MTAPDAATEGARRADEFLDLLTRDDAEAAERLLARLTEVRDLVFLGAGITTRARRESRALPPAQRAQASGRQAVLGQLRDANRGDVEGLRVWLRRAGAEVLLVRSQLAAAQQLSG